MSFATFRLNALKNISGMTMYILCPEIDITLLRDAGCGKSHLETVGPPGLCILLPQIQSRRVGFTYCFHKFWRAGPGSQMCYISNPERVPKSTLNKSDTRTFKIKWLE